MSTTSNGINPELAERHLKKVLGVYDELEAQKINNMNRCRDIRSALPDLYEAAKIEGLPIRAFKLSVKRGRIERKIEGLQEDIEDLAPEDEDDAAAFQMLQAALGSFSDTPLGAVTLDQAAAKRDEAAAKKAAKAAKDTKAEGQPEPPTDQQAADDALTQQNVERLKGITAIPGKEPFEDDASAAKPSRAQKRAAKLDDLTKH